MSISYPTVSLRVTKGKQFRASVVEKEGDHPYEITINGDDWRKCKKTSLEARKKIKSKVSEFFKRIKSEYEKMDELEVPRYPVPPFKTDFGWIR